MSLENSPDFLLNFSELDAMNGEEKHFYQFKSFRLDVAERQLSNKGVSIPLTPKAFDVLSVLVERSGHLVDKDELLKLVWSDSFVEEANISRIIHTLRRVLGENGNGNKFIETVAKKGYRFVAEVSKVSETARNPESRNQDSSAFAEDFPETKSQVLKAATDKISVPLANTGQHRARIFLISISFLSAVLLISLFAFNRQSASRVNSAGPKSIAVLPIKPVNTDNRDLIYELGIAESLISRLGGVKSLTVRPLSATRRYMDTEQDAITAGKEQNVDYVLASNYQVVDGRIRVTSQLINVQTGAIEETLKSDKDSIDKFLMQDAIANDFGNILLARFGKTAGNQTANFGTTNEEAYRLYLKAEYILEEFNEPKIGKAIEYLEQAIKLDPNYAAAYVSLAHAYQYNQFSWSKNLASDEEYYLKSKEAIEKALALDENSADAHAVLGFIISGYEHDFARAEKEYQMAIGLNPNSGLAHGLYAYYLSNTGRFDEALGERTKAIEIDPASVINQVAYGMILYYAHRYEEAAEHFKKMSEKDENSYFPCFWLWAVYAAQGNEPEAYEWFIKYQTQIKSDPETIRMYQMTYQKFGIRGILKEVIRQDEKTVATNNNPDLLYESACFNAKLGNKDKAFEYLDKAYKQRRSSLNFIKVDPFLDSLHSDPRFEDLVRRIGLK